MINRRTQYETNIYYHKILQQKYKITNFSKKYENAHTKYQPPQTRSQNMKGSGSNHSKFSGSTCTGSGL